MTYTLVIVESPAKCQKIESYLGPGYRCIASIGHLQSLSSLKDIDISNNYTPKYSPIEAKKGQIKKIKDLILPAKDVIIATDDDREGEAIGWHICQLFNLSVNTTKRIIFHEITKNAIQSAISQPTVLNLNLINAQQGRQILDLIVGYKISPILWNQISRTKKGLSAGRCQTPALRLIYDNYIEIKNSPGTKVYNVTGYFTDKTIPFILNHNFNNEDTTTTFLENSVDFDHKLTCEKPKDSIRKAPTPFTTSTLQQTSSSELHISPKDTMMTCQKLYEGGYITYMRTDSKIYSKDFIDTALKFVETNYGVDYQSNNIETLTGAQKTNEKKKAKKESLAQEAHEAIRPTNINITQLPDDGDFSSRERRLYKLIWKNTIQSCMADARFKTILAKITAPQEFEYRYTGETIVFLGWKIIDSDKVDTPAEALKKIAYEYLPKIKGIVSYKKITAKFSLKDLKTHFTEAKLVQLLEQKGIGRPSTFSSLIDKIQDREYVKKENIKGQQLTCTDFELEENELLEIESKREFGNEKGKLVIQPIGILVVEFLIAKYPEIFDYEYTKNMEDQLDLIAKGNKQYYELCKDCMNLIDSTQLQSDTNIKIDEYHQYVIGKHGPVIKFNNGSDVKFYSIKSDIDLDKLKNQEYKLDDLIEDTALNKKLGDYENNELFLKKGKFGLYVVWGTNKKSINNINIRESDITLEDVIPLLTNNTNQNIIRKINDSFSIRKGQYGNYIFYKTEKMTKPRFLKLTNFEEDYNQCSNEILLTWIKETYKI
tara:strand:- start:4669 stop:6978 length:2310 start_codon:yes stop_codon:yes gene_type:complete